MKLETITLEGAEAAIDLITALVDRSQYFTFTPLPDDHYEISYKPENKAFVDASLNKQPMFTVVLLYPDYSSEDYGADIFVETAEAQNAHVATGVVQEKASIANDSTIPPDDFRPIAVMRGDIVLALDATDF